MCCAMVMSNVMIGADGNCVDVIGSYSNSAVTATIDSTDAKSTSAEADSIGDSTGDESIDVDSTDTSDDMKHWCMPT